MSQFEAVNEVLKEGTPLLLGIEVIVEKASSVEAGRSLASPFLLLSVVGADGHEPKTSSVLTGRYVDRLIGRNDYLGCSVLRYDQLGDVLFLKLEIVSDLVIDGLQVELFAGIRQHRDLIIRG